MTEVLSPIEFTLDNNKTYKIECCSTFDSYYSDNNSKLAEILGITEDDAFILGNFGKYFSKNILDNRAVKISDGVFLYYKFNYITRLKNSPYCIINGKPSDNYAFQRELAKVRMGKFVILDLDSDNYYPVGKDNADKIKNYVIVRKSQAKHSVLIENHINDNSVSGTDKKYKSKLDLGGIKIVLSDMTTKLIPDRKCSSDICKEILDNIKNSQNTIDIAIYGYSSTPDIEKAIIDAQKRGVKIRLVYDLNSSGENIYPDTKKLLDIIPNSVNDKTSAESNYTMHNKFYIFDDKTLITGSANLSHTDMSGYNSNSIIVIKNPDIIKYYKTEFEQLYSGKFHSEKSCYSDKKTENMQVFFSPCDKGIANGIIPLIKNAKRYIYIPAFVITERHLTEELIKASKRGVEVKIIADALNASTQHSKHKELRGAGILVKAENYAGKMHSKTIIIDDEYLVIGSMNFSYSGENRNDENFIILENNDAAKFYKEFFLYQWEKIPDKWLKYIPRAEGKDSIGSCFDGIDNNYDGKIDINDKACK